MAPLVPYDLSRDLELMSEKAPARLRERVAHLDIPGRYYSLRLISDGVSEDTAVRLIAFGQDAERVYGRYSFLRRRLSSRDYSPECVAALCWLERRSSIDAWAILKESASYEIPFSKLNRHERRRVKDIVAAPVPAKNLELVTSS